MSWVCGSRCISSARSSSTSFCSADEDFSSSRLVLGRIANEMTPAGASAAASRAPALFRRTACRRWWCLSAWRRRRSRRRSRSRAATASCPRGAAAGRSAPCVSRVELSTAASSVRVPEMTRKIESLPANGSITVLKTRAANGAAGSCGTLGRLAGRRDSGIRTGGRSLGAGRKS